MNPPPIPNTVRPRASRGARVAITLLSLALAASLLSNCRSRPAERLFQRAAACADQPEDQFPAFAETPSYGRGPIKAVRILVSGVIDRSGDTGLFGLSEDPTESVLRQIRAATNDEDVRGILLEVDSPGGAITPTDEIAQALKTFRESREDRRVVAFIRDMAASGGYYVIARADRIIAEPTAMIGSISVILQTLNWHALSERVGVTDITIKSGRNKDLLNPFQPVSDEQRAILQRMVNSLHEGFLKIVREGRHLDDTALEQLADGSVFTAAEARERGLVDEIGYWEYAARQLADCLDVADVRIVKYRETRSLLDTLARLRSPIQVPGVLSRHGPTAWALWNP